MEEDVKNNVEENVEESAEQVRSPRESEDREVEQRVESWENPSNLPNPTPQPGWVFRWIRTSLLGNADNPNVSKKFREGWQPCRSEDHPELHIHMMDYKSEWADKGNMEVGGLLLCKAPRELMEQRDEYYRKVAREQMEAVDNNYLKENDPRMPLLQPDRKTRTTFGGK